MFLAHAAEVLSSLPMETAVPDPNANGAGAAPGFAGQLITNGRSILIGVIAVLLLSITAAALVFGAFRANTKKTLLMIVCTLIALIPAGIVLGVGFVLVAKGVVDITGF